MRINARVEMSSAAGFRDITETVGDAAALAFAGAGLDYETNGYLPLYVKMMEYVTDTQIWSAAVAFCVVLLIISVLAGSAKLALIALIANIFPVVVVLGTMGWTGIPLDVATVTIAAVVIGIIVDDSIHLIYGLRTGARGDWKQTLSDVGRPVVSTSVILILGFLVMTAASIKSIAYFGLLSALGIAAALAGDLLIFPSIHLLVTKKGKADETTA